MAKIQISGGNFQDAEGNILDHGSLTLQLSQDAQVNDSEIGAGLTFNAPLDKSGDVMGTNQVLISTIQTIQSTGTLIVTSAINMTSLISIGDKIVFPTGLNANFLNSQVVTVVSIAGNGLSFTANFFNADYGPLAEIGASFTIGVSIFLWPNDQLNPSNTYYVLNAYSSLGQYVWGPFYGNISGPTPFDLGSLIPPGSGGAPIGSILLQTNSINNSLQSKLNLTSSDGSVSLINSAGTTDIKTSIGGTPINFTVAPAWWGSGEGSTFPFSNGGNGTWGTGVANQVKVWAMRIPFPIKISKLTWWNQSNLTTSKSAFGMYDSSGNKIWSKDAIATDTGQAGGVKRATITPITLTPGFYYGASSCDTTGASPSVLGCYLTSGSNEPAQGWNNGVSGIIRTGIATNLMSSAILPATLGVLSTNATMGQLLNITMEP